MPLKDNLLQLAAYVQSQLAGFPRLLSQQALDRTGEADAWSAKDNLFHSLVWADRRLEILETLERGESWTEIDYGDFNEANREIFEEYRHHAWDDLLARIESTYSGIVRYLDRTSPQRLASTPEGEDRAIWRRITDSFVLHPMIHVWGCLVEYGLTDQLASIFGEKFSDKLLKLDESESWRGLVQYNLACIQALTGDLDQSLSTLRSALKNNPDLKEWSLQDPDLAAIRGNPVYEALYKGMD